MPARPAIAPYARPTSFPLVLMLDEDSFSNIAVTPGSPPLKADDAAVRKIGPALGLQLYG